MFDFFYHHPTATWKHDRSLLLDHANHEIDLLNFIYGITGFSASRLKDAYDGYEISGVRTDVYPFRSKVQDD